MTLLILALTGCGGAPTASPPDQPAGAERGAAVVEAPAHSSGEEPAAPPPPGTLLFVSERTGQPRVWRVDTSGANERELGATPPGAVFPAAPDPRASHALVIQVREDESGHAERLWLVPLGGEGELTEASALTPFAGKVRNPSWGPGGSWLAFETDASSFRDLYRVDRDGGELQRLTEAEHGSFEPQVSKDGSRIAFGTSRDGNAEVYTMGSDGSDPVRVTRHDSDDTAPRWSPDGRTLAWKSRRDGTEGIWVVTAGGQPERLRTLEGKAIELDAVWSPDGRHLAIPVQTGPKEVRIDVVAFPSGEVVASHDGSGPDEHPAWSPDGRWLAFSSAREGEPAIFAVEALGGVPVKVSAGKTDWLPRWVAAPQASSEPLHPSDIAP